MEKELLELSDSQELSPEEKIQEIENLLAGPVIPGNHDDSDPDSLFDQDDSEDSEDFFSAKKNRSGIRPHYQPMHIP